MSHSGVSYSSNAATPFTISSTYIVPDNFLTLFKDFLAWSAGEGGIISSEQCTALLAVMPLRSYVDSAGVQTHQIADMYKEMLDLERGVPVGKHRELYSSYNKSFRGREAVDWMLAKGYAVSRTEAVALGRHLIKHGFAIHVEAKHNFEDSYLLYRFRDEQPAFALVPSADIPYDASTLLRLVYHMHEDTVDSWMASATVEDFRVAYPAVIMWTRRHMEYADKLRERVLAMNLDSSLMMAIISLARANGDLLGNQGPELTEDQQLTCSIVVDGHPAKHVRQLAGSDDAHGFAHPFGPFQAHSVVVEKEFVSDAKPAWLSFRDENGAKILPDAIAKHGDDLRKDLAVQLIFKVCDAIWRSAPVEWRIDRPSVRTYDVMVASEKSGFIEFVPGRTVKEVDEARDWGDVDLVKFAPSAVGSYVAGFVLGVRDRHTENWMLVEPEELMQIDFGYLLLENPGGFPLDTPRLTMQPRLVKRFKEQRGPSGRSLMEDFQHDLVTAYAVLREHRHAFTTFCKTVLSNVYPPAKVESFLWGRHSFRSAQDERSALEHFEGKVISQLSTSVWRRAAKHALVKAYYAARRIV